MIIELACKTRETRSCKYLLVSRKNFRIVINIVIIKKNKEKI